MAKSRQRKPMFGQPGKGRVSVHVGGADVQMTDTQACRFEELQKARGSASGGETGLFQAPRYSLEDAAFRLMISEAELLAKAADGRIRAYVGVSGRSGRWRSYASGGESRESTRISLQSGYLALTVNACRELAKDGRTPVSILEYVHRDDPAVLEIEAEVLAAFVSWGRGSRFFCLATPLTVAAQDLIFLSPLSG